MGSISLRKMGERRKKLSFLLLPFGGKGRGEKPPLSILLFPYFPPLAEIQSDSQSRRGFPGCCLSHRLLRWDRRMGVLLGVGPLSKGGRGGKFLGRIGGENWRKGVLVGVGGNLIKGRGKSWLMRMRGEVTGRGQTQFCGGGKKKEFPQTTGK